MGNVTMSCIFCSCCCSLVVNREKRRGTRAARWEGTGTTPGISEALADKPTRSWKSKLTPHRAPFTAGGPCRTSRRDTGVSRRR